MRLLVTRPERDGEASAARLRGLGHNVLVEPLLHIVLAPQPAGLPDPAALVVTSRNGVRALAGWPQAGSWRDRPLFAIGRATAEVAHAAGFSLVRNADGDGAVLGAAVRALLPPGRGPILYPAARDRAGDLATDLGAAGYDVRVVEAYYAEAAGAFSPAVASVLSGGGLDGALFYSRRTAETFRGLVGSGAIRLPHLFALSAQVAEPLAGLGGRLHVAAAPDEASLFALLPPP